jgi:hypothetical protein
MSTREKLIQARVSMPALADELQNISRACQMAGISQSHFYDVKEAFAKYGREGLAPQAGLAQHHRNCPETFSEVHLNCLWLAPQRGTQVRPG